MQVFFDTSALTKRYVEEEGSEEGRALCAQASAIDIAMCPSPSPPPTARPSPPASLPPRSCRGWLGLLRSGRSAGGTSDWCRRGRLRDRRRACGRDLRG